MPSISMRGIRAARRTAGPGPLRTSGLMAAHEDAGVTVTYDAVYQRVDPADGERRLLLAVLEDGVRTVLKYAAATRGRGRRLQREALSWMLSDAHTDVFAYASICEALEIDPDRLRGRVLERVRAVAPAALAC